MRAAPPVEISLGSGRRERGWLALIWAAAVMALTTWAQLHGWLPQFSWLPAMGAVCAAWVCWRKASPIQGKLIWDGQLWAWQAPGGAQRQPLAVLRVALDLGSWLLLRTESGRWCGVSAGHVGPQWHGLQLALRNGVRTNDRESAP